MLTAVRVDTSCPSSQVTDAVAVDSTDYLTQSKISVLRGSKDDPENVVLHDVVSSNNTRMHLLWLSSNTDLEALCKLALTAADAVLIFLDDLQTNLPHLQSLFKVVFADIASFATRV